MSSSQEVSQSDYISDRLIAGDKYESDLIKLLYEIDAGEEYTDFLIGEVGPGSGTYWLEQPCARINELFEALGIESKKWVDSRINSTDRRANGIWEPIALSGREARSIKLDGITIGKFFTRSADNALPIESGEDGDMYIEISFNLPNDYMMRLKASGSVEFIYPDADVEDQESELAYSIKFEADILHSNTV